MARTATPVYVLGGAPRVNLMPRAAIERRERSVTLRKWGWALAATLLLVGLLSGGAFALQALSAQRLAAEERDLARKPGEEAVHLSPP